MALIGKSVVVAGGSRGIGRAITCELAAAGADVAFFYNSNTAAAEETVAMAVERGGTAYALQCDITEAAAVGRAMTHAAELVGTPKIVAITAGATPPTKGVHDLTESEWRGFVDVDLNGAFNVSQQAVRQFRDGQGGLLIAMSSIAVRMAPALNAAGAAAKAGVEALIRAIAREEARYGTRANTVSVGVTATDMIAPIFEKWGGERTERVLKGIPLRQVGQPEKIAKMVAFLASEDAAYMTGKIIELDGGQHIGG